jgi:hypothetical protein
MGTSLLLIQTPNSSRLGCIVVCLAVRVLDGGTKSNLLKKELPCRLALFLDDLSPLYTEMYVAA